MNYLLLILGILILLIVLGDLVFTTFSPNGAGYLTDIITKGLWNFSLLLCRNDGSKKLLEYVGIFTVTTVVAIWLLFIWAGSSLIICSDAHSVVNTNTKAPAGIWEKVYYTGFTLSTLGVGDFSANKDIWRIFTVVLSLSGFMFITTGISYMLPVVSADVQKKNLSLYISMLGGSPQDILLNHWKNGHFHALETHFSSLLTMINLHSQQLLAYPVLYCFHSSDPLKSTAVTIAKLDEALTILLLYVPENCRPGNEAIAPLRKAITHYLVTQNKYFIKPRDTSLSQPNLSKLRQAAIPLSDDQDAMQAGYSKLNERRSVIGKVLRNEGWEFKEVYRIYEQSTFEVPSTLDL